MPDFTVRSGGCAFSRLVYIFNLNQYAWTLPFMPHHRYDHTFLYRACDCPTLDSYHTHYLIITLWRLEMHLKYTISVQLRLSWSWNLKEPQKLRNPCVAFNWSVDSRVLLTLTDQSLGVECRYAWWMQWAEPHFSNIDIMQISKTVYYRHLAEWLHEVLICLKRSFFFLRI